MKIKPKKISKRILRDNSRCIKIIFNAAFDGKKLDGKDLSMLVAGNLTSIIAGGEIMLSSNGVIHPILNIGWFKYLNGDPIYDRKKSLSLVVSLRRSGLLV
jgi:hypothetical protein